MRGEYDKFSVADGNSLGSWCRDKTQSCHGVIMTTCGGASDNKVRSMIIFGSQWWGCEKYESKEFDTMVN